MSFARRLGPNSSERMPITPVSPTDSFRAALTQTAKNWELKKQQQKRQELLEKQVATNIGLQEELRVRDIALEMLHTDLEQKQKRIIDLEAELEQFETSDAVDVAQHLYLLRDAVAEVYRFHMCLDASSVEVSLAEGGDSLASSGCSMKATVNAHFPLRDRDNLQPPALDTPQRKSRLTRRLLL
jgi:hypothetical protein